MEECSRRVLRVQRVCTVFFYGAPKWRWGNRRFLWEHSSRLEVSCEEIDPSFFFEIHLLPILERSVVLGRVDGGWGFGGADVSLGGTKSGSSAALRDRSPNASRTSPRLSLPIAQLLGLRVPEPRDGVVGI